MVTNLPAVCKAKWAKVALAKTPQEKIQLLQDFYSSIPKHKGTSKLCANIKRQIATLKAQVEEERRRGRPHGKGWFIKKQGAAQIVILGLTKVGKSSLLSSVTNAKPLISEYPFTTTEPITGMFPFEDLQFQLVECPALTAGASEGAGWGLKVLALARNADGLIIMIDLSKDPCEQFQLIKEELENARILIEKPQARVEIEKGMVGAGIQIVGRLADCTANDVKQLLQSYGVQTALVKVYGKATLDDVEDAVLESTVYKPTVIVANKADVNQVEANVNRLKEAIGNRFKILIVSCKCGLGLDDLGETIFQALDIIRVYTKEPNEENPSPRPIVMKNGVTVIEVAKSIHTFLYRNFKYARIWGSSKYPGEKVGGEHILKDKDVVEIHTK
ncbi:50S ribosome-binding GTPase [Candidatus Bathyarchaeota archaeon]|nr:50S ribosome-binding GTPase [Candidatus Bathyarchaeota archaeon]